MGCATLSDSLGALPPHCCEQQRTEYWSEPFIFAIRICYCQTCAYQIHCRIVGLSSHEKPSLRGAGLQENIAPGIIRDRSSKLASAAERKKCAATVHPLPEPANPQQEDMGSVQNSPVRKIRYDMQQQNDDGGDDGGLLDDAMKTPLKRPPSLPTPVSLVGAPQKVSM